MIGLKNSFIKFQVVLMTNWVKCNPVENESFLSRIVELKKKFFSKSIAQKWS